MRYILLISFFIVCENSNAGGRVLSTDRNSSSLIIRSDLIFAFTTDQITPDFPIDDLPHGSKPWKLNAHVLKIYKGSLKDEKKTSFDTTVSIYHGPVRARPAGLWVNETPSKDSKWVAYCIYENSGITLYRPEDLLNGLSQDCRVQQHKEVNTGLNIANAISKDHLSFDIALKKIKQNPKEIDSDLASFFLYQFRKNISEEFKAFDKVLRLSEDILFPRTSRFTLLNEIQNFGWDSPKKEEQYNGRLALSYFRTIGLGNEDDSRNAIETFIPNLVGIVGGMTKISTTRLFLPYPGEREKAHKKLIESPFKKEAQMLLKWIEQK